MIGCRGFAGKNVEGRTGDLSTLQRGRQGIFIDESTLGAVDDATTGFKLLQQLGIDKVARFLIEGDMQRNKVSARQQLGQIHLFGTNLQNRLGRDIGVVDQRVHSQADGAFDDQPANLTRANNTKGLPRQLDT